MNVDPAHLAHARAVADAILYEGYLLYPYRASAQKNRARFQFGVIMPSAYRAVDGSERAAAQAECVLDCPDDAEVHVRARFLQLQRRTTEVLAPPAGTASRPATGGAGGEPAHWDEAIERAEEAQARVGALLTTRHDVDFRFDGGQATEQAPWPGGAGWTRRRWWTLRGTIGLSASRVAGPYGALRLRVRLENHTRPDGPLRTRDDGLRHAMIAAHLLIAVPGARFHSMVDPPEWAASEVAACANIGVWPVLAGPPECSDLVLACPVILYDHPEIAAESAGELYDSTEIDEILTLRTLALTDAEKHEARATDSRAAALIDRVDAMPPELLGRLHGAIRYLRAVPGAQAGPAAPGTAAGGQVPPRLAPAAEAAGAPAAAVTARPPVPWWDPGADASVSPETDHVAVGGVRIARGSRVRMRPGTRRADAQDLFLAGRPARVEAVLHDVDGRVHLAVTPEDDPAAAVNRSHGRYLYFAPDEVEPIDTVPPASPG